VDREKDLIERCLRGDPVAQKELYDRYARRMYGVCLRFAAHNLQAQDILQEGFIRVFSKLKQFRFKSPLEAWIRVIFINTAITLSKKELRYCMREPLTAGFEAGSNLMDGFMKLSMDDMVSLIQELPAGYRTVFNLYVIEGYSHKEIGRKLGISENTSKSQLLGAKRSLRKKLLELANSDGRERR